MESEQAAQFLVERMVGLGIMLAQTVSKVETKGGSALRFGGARAARRLARQVARSCCLFNVTLLATTFLFQRLPQHRTGIHLGRTHVKYLLPQSHQ